VYCIAELAAAIYVGSLTLLSDGFHNLSDVLSLGIAYWAQKVSGRNSDDSMSYGWARSEILGGLTNGCFLISLCLYVGLEAIPRFINPPPIEAGMIFIIIAACGLGVNTFGTLLFAGVGLEHSHGGHSHSHGDHDHGHGKKQSRSSDDESQNLLVEEPVKKKAKRRDWNMIAVFLHYLGDAVSSLFVLSTGLIIHFVPDKAWVHYIDPASSLLIVAIILATTIPLVKRCSMILLQSVPSTIEMETLRSDILKLRGVLQLHDFHVWQLVDGMIICSVHLICEEGTDYTTIVSAVKQILHSQGIHSSAIQPEFVQRNLAADEIDGKSFCPENCVKECDEDWCCKKTAEISEMDHHDHDHHDHDDHDHGHGHSINL